MSTYITPRNASSRISSQNRHVSEADVATLVARRRYISKRIQFLLLELGYTPPEPTLDPNAIKSGDAAIAADFEGI